MNAAGMIFIVDVLARDPGLPFYQTLVTGGTISQGEYDATRNNLTAVVATLRNTPSDKIEAMVAQYDDRLTEQNAKYSAMRGQDILGGFQHAQIMAGYVTTIMAKSGLKE